jgi:hypothetical protein
MCVVNGLTWEPAVSNSTAKVAYHFGWWGRPKGRGKLAFAGREGDNFKVGGYLGLGGGRGAQIALLGCDCQRCGNLDGNARREKGMEDQRYLRIVGEQGHRQECQHRTHWVGFGR